MAIHDYLDKFPGEYQAERDKYEKSMDKHFEDLDMLSMNKFGRHYDELSVTDQKEIEAMIDNKKARKGSGVFQLDNGKVVGAKEAEEYKKNYGKMMDDAWEQYKKSKERKGLACPDCENASKIILNRLTRGI